MRRNRTFKSRLFSLLILACATTTAFGEDVKSDVEDSIEDLTARHGLGESLQLWNSGEELDALTLLCSGFGPAAKLYKEIVTDAEVSVEVVDSDGETTRNEILSTFREKHPDALKDLFDLLTKDSVEIGGVPYSPNHFSDLEDLLAGAAFSLEEVCDDPAKSADYYSEFTIQTINRSVRKTVLNDSANDRESSHPASWLASAYFNRIVSTPGVATVFVEGDVGIVDSNESTTTPFGLVRFGLALVENGSAYKPHDPPDGLRFVTGIDAARIYSGLYGAAAEVAYRYKSGKKSSTKSIERMVTDFSVSLDAINNPRGVSNSTFGVRAEHRWEFADSSPIGKGIVEFGFGAHIIDNDVQNQTNGGPVHNVFFGYEKALFSTSLSIRAEMGYESSINMDLDLNENMFVSTELHGGYGMISLLYRKPEKFYVVYDEVENWEKVFIEAPPYIPSRWRGSEKRGSRRYLNLVNEYFER